MPRRMQSTEQETIIPRVYRGRQSFCATTAWYSCGYSRYMAYTSRPQLLWGRDDVECTQYGHITAKVLQYHAVPRSTTPSKIHHTGKWAQDEFNRSKKEVGAPQQYARHICRPKKQHLDPIERLPSWKQR
jgi:hypothetical protein